MEIAVDQEIPTYSGGLGVLAGDTIRAAADLGVPMLGVSLLYRKGYFYQRIDANGWQKEESVEWVIQDFLEEIPVRWSGTLEGQSFEMRAWKYTVTGATGYVVPVYFIDTDIEGNAPYIRSLTQILYGGDQKYRLCQEAVLGIGGVRMLNVLGYSQIDRYHMNEGHASLLVLELLELEARKAGRTKINSVDIQRVREKCIFTTHTPVPAGHDQFPMDLVAQVLGHHEDLMDDQDPLCASVFNRIIGQGKEDFDLKKADKACMKLNMTYVALNLSHYINGVAKKHGEVSAHMFAGYHIDAITNGIHAHTWTSDSFRVLYDRYMQGWRQDNFSLRSALAIPKQEVWEAHMEEKRRLIRLVNRTTNAGMDLEVLTIGFARRATPYKRPDLLFADLNRLKRIASEIGPFQVIYAGKAHPNDGGGKEMIQRIWRLKQELKQSIRITYLENYDFALGKLMTAGVDVWLNTPEPPLEASGTSGMKAAVNGVPSLSMLDGWWIEGHIEGITGWSIGERTNGNPQPDSAMDAALLYEKLENVVIPTFYKDRNAFVEIMRNAIALNGSFFNTHRMLQQYVLNAYYR